MTAPRHPPMPEPVRRTVASRGRGLALWLGAALALGACGPDEEGPVASLDPPACKSVTLFGNGAACSSADAKLATCGTKASRTCASGWLCFDAPEFVDCSCTVAADCEARATYINAARVTARRAPLAAKCEFGRCAGRP